jgi:putative ABC transport system substrate-binding protein
VKKHRHIKPLLLLIGFIVATIHFAEAQQPAKIPRIGYLSGTGDALNQGPYVEALRQGLKELGYMEGKNFKIEYRGAEGKLDRLPSIMNERVQLKIDVLVAPFTGAVQAAKQATTTIPIVMVTGIEPVANGWVASLARPGGNITGAFTLAQDLNGKRLELLTEVVPRVSHIAVLLRSDRGSSINYKEYQAAAHALKVHLESLEVSGDEPDVDGAFRSAAYGRAIALITITSAALFLKL